MVGIATKTGILDLTGLNFTEPGDYTFTLRETNSSDTNYLIDPANYYTITVSVRNALDANDRPTGSLTISLAHIKQNNLDKIQDVGFDGNSMSGYIDISKEVKGNMADDNEYFKVLVNVTCPTGYNGYEYPIYYRDDSTGSTNVDRTITYNGGSINRMPIDVEDNDGGLASHVGKYTCGGTNYIYLKHGETAVINIPFTATTYSFTEQGASNYTTYINGNNTNSKQSGNITVGDKPFNRLNCDTSCLASNTIKGKLKPKNLSTIKSLEEADYCPVVVQPCNENRNVIVNVASSQVPTGSFIKYVPYAVLVLVVGGALTLFFIVNRRHKKEEIKEM